MKEETRQILDQVTKDFEKIKHDLIQTFGGDEGHDIGDASSAAELIGNLYEARHEYTRRDVTAFLSGRLQRPKTAISRMLQDMRTWDEKEWEKANG